VGDEDYGGWRIEDIWIELSHPNPKRVRWVAQPCRTKFSDRGLLRSIMPINRSVSTLRHAAKVSIAVLALGLFALLAARPLQTAKKSLIQNWVFSPNDVIMGGTNYGPGSLKETGANPQNVTTFTQEAEFTPVQIATIKADDKKAHPSITFVKDPTPAYDCHGYSFKNRALWIDDDQVKTIRDDQGWMMRPAGQVQVGDLAIYMKDGNITHTGIVNAVAGGNATRIQSKWGSRGEYIHDPLDVPAGYGTPEYWFGGTELADPPLDEDQDLFGGHVPPPLKDSIKITEFNTLAVPPLKNLAGGPTTWIYGLGVTQVGMQVSPGDTLEIFASNINSAIVQGSASQTAYGAWQVVSYTSSSATFQATASAFVPASKGVVDGFTLLTSAPNSGVVVYVESVAGSVGRTSGPVPAPCAINCTPSN
jgi:hypothetical protein